MRSSALLVGLAFWLAAPGSCADGLIAHWTMDEMIDGALPDASGNGHDAKFGAKEDGAPEFVAGIVGKAVKLDANAEVFFTAAKSEDFNFKGPFTVMAWVKPTRRNATFEIACMKGDKSGDPPWPGWRLRFFWARAMLQVGTPEGEEPRAASPEWSVPAGFWSHVAGSWDGERLRVFVNGVEKGSAEFAGEIAPQRQWRPLILGNYIGRKNAYAFDGLLDDIKIFSRALGEDEVLQNARQTTD